MSKLTCVFLSDTHLQHNLTNLPSGDVLCHSGDFLNSGSYKNWLKFKNHLLVTAVNFKYVLLVPGNHDHFVENDTQFVREELKGTNITLLVDEEIEIEGKRFYGSPWTPRFGPWAYMKDRGKDLAAVWANIPEGLDVLITHGPPVGIMDDVKIGGRINVGCVDLKARLLKMKDPPKVMVFGHIHRDFGDHNTFYHPKLPTLFINASICDNNYDPINSPVVYDI